MTVAEWITNVSLAFLTDFLFYSLCFLLCRIGVPCLDYGEVVRYAFETGPVSLRRFTRLAK